MDRFPTNPPADQAPPREPEKNCTIESITDPESLKLKEFHDFLGTIFNPAELDPFEVYQEELRNQDSNTRYLCFIAVDADGKVVSCAYGSLIKDILALRFLATEVSNRGSGISQKVNLQIVKEAKGLGEIHAIVGEAVNRSESYWNKLEIFETGNSMRRLYYANPDTGEPDPARQVFYRLPPFEWNPDGTPVNDPQQTENLQVAIAGHKGSVLVEELAEILRLWWKQWYIRSKKQFENDEAFAKHVAYVMSVLENEIIKPMKDSGQEFVIPMSKAERLKKEQPKK